MPLFARTVLSPLALALAFAAPARAADSPPTPAEPMTATAAVAALHFPAATVTKLENGLTVVLEENHRSPYVAMHLRYDAGSRDDPPGKEGLAAIAERMTTMGGTKHVPARGYDGTLDRIGATERGSRTALDWISQWVTVPSNGVASVLWLWSDQMGFFEPDDPSEILRARIAILRLPEDTVTDPVGTIVQRALFSDASRRDSIGKSGEHVTLDDVRSFAARSLAPNGAVLVLVGDFESAPTLERIQTYFGPISPATAPRATLRAPAQLEDELQLSMTTRAKVTEVWMDWRTPPLFAAGDAELDVFARAMVGTRDALLRSTLVEKMRVATRVTARQISHASGSDFRITAVVAPGHTLDEVKVALDETLRFIREQGLSDGAFASARANVTVPYVHDLDRPGRRATAYATLAMMHRDPRRLAGDVGRYDAVTSSGVNATMARWLTKEHRLVSAIVPTASATDGGPPATRGAK